MSLYTKRGVSAQKEEVHQATAMLDKGIFPNAFCKIYPDLLCGEANWVNVMHADGAGTKSILAYLYWRETDDVDVWKGIAKDAVAMNLDDLLCVGIYDNLLFSSTIDRNKKLIPGEVLQALIGGTQEFFDDLKKFGINIHYLGGETADVGDLLRTIAVNGTITARWPKNKLVTNDRIAAGDMIIGLASFGQANYENAYNSGIGSNGLTSARHDVLNKSYAEKFPESADPALEADVAYIGRHRISEKIETEWNGRQIHSTVGELLLSPTRTYAPVLKNLLEEFGEKIHGLIHCSGGGQTKCMKYLPGNFRITKSNLFQPPYIFQLIKESSGADDREMYQVFNMGHRLEIFTEENTVEKIIKTADKFGIEAQVVGRVEAAERKELILETPGGRIKY
jgi:phosphoribosylformylglycinamidine cyclo-ligase